MMLINPPHPRMNKSNLWSETLSQRPPAPRMDLKTADFQRFFFCENQILPLLLPLSFIFI